MAAIAADAIVLAAPKLDCAQGREVLGILRNLDQVLRLAALWNFDLSLLPHARDVGLPGLAHAAYETVRPAQ